MFSTKGEQALRDIYSRFHWSYTNDPHNAGCNGNDIERAFLTMCLEGMIDITIDIDLDEPHIKREIDNITTCINSIR